MSVTKCLKCDEPVLIPSGASLKATVRCPLCHEQFELGEMLDAIPPPLEIVQDPEAVAVSEVQPFNFDVGDKSDDKSADADSFAGVGDQADGDDAAEGSAPAFQFDAATSEGDSAGGAKSTRPTARPKRKAKNPAVEMAKVVGGGVLGIALAILGIWWGPKVFGKPPKDILDIGPKVSKIAPWIVPQELHDKPKENDEGDGKDKDKDKKGAPPAQGTENHNSARDQNRQNNNRELSDSKFTDSGNQQANSNQPNTVDNPKKNNKPPVDRTSPEFVGLRNAVTPNSTAVKQTLNKANVALTIWNPDDELDTEAFRKDARNKIAALGEHICYADQSDSSIQDLVDDSIKLLEELRGRPETRKILNSWAAENLKQGVDDPTGILFAGEVQAIENGGALFEIQLELLTEGREAVTVLIKNDPTEHAPPGAKLIVLGVLVDNPAENFSGYGGDEPQVVAAGALALLEPLVTGKRSKSPE